MSIVENRVAVNAVDQTEETEAINKSVKAAEQIVDQKIEDAEGVVDAAVNAIDQAPDQQMQEANQFVDQKRENLERTIHGAASYGQESASQQATNLLGKLHLEATSHAHKRTCSLLNVEIVENLHIEKITENVYVYVGVFTFKNNFYLIVCKTEVCKDSTIFYFN
uniref:Uncharacterized protein n=1 Tax=Glossina morsitans morsitans TaxID=37546 RepID=A0A1B0F9L4_GLOMM